MRRKVLALVVIALAVAPLGATRIESASAGTSAKASAVDRGTYQTQTAELKGSDTVAHNSFGGSVAISGTTAIVGAPLYDDLAGRAYVFIQTGTNWEQVAELKGSDTVAGNELGLSVAVSGTTDVVGAFGHAGGGRAYIFQA
jgi:hypothetical protein